MSELPETQSVLESVRRLEERISRIEAHLGIAPTGEGAGAADGGIAQALAERAALEQQIGQQLFAKLGIAALIVGIAFLLTIPYRGLSPVFPSAAGYLIAAGTLFWARRYRAVLGHLAGYLSGGGIFLVFFATLRLHFFGSEAPVQSPAVEGMLLGAAALSGLALAIATSSISLIVLGLVLVETAALLAGVPLALFGTAAAVILAASFLARRSGRPGLVPIATGLSFVVHLLWFLDLPIPGRTAAPPSLQAWSAYAVLVYAGFAAAGELLQSWKPAEGGAAIAAALVSGAAGYLLFVFVTLPGLGTGFAGAQLAAFALFLAAAAAYWLYRRSIYTTFIYAIAGYLALTAAILAAFPAPAYFFWLSLQSLLVVVTAVWFRSRFIVIANFVIFLTLAVSSQILAGAASPVTLSTGVVALLTAHLLTSRKARLGLNGSVMRNAYLACALLVIPPALARWIPPGLVSQAWLVLALCYYLGARVFHAAMYRWMALLTLVLTAGYVLLVDLGRIDPVYRVISCIILGIVLLAVSLVYSRRRGRPGLPPVTDPSVPGTGTAFRK